MHEGGGTEVPPAHCQRRHGGAPQGISWGVEALFDSLTFESIRRALMRDERQGLRCGFHNGLIVQRPAVGWGPVGQSSAEGRAFQLCRNHIEGAAVRDRNFPSDVQAKA